MEYPIFIRIMIRVYIKLSSFFEDNKLYSYRIKTENKTNDEKTRLQRLFELFQLRLTLAGKSKI